MKNDDSIGEFVALECEAENDISDSRLTADFYAYQAPFERFYLKISSPFGANLKMTFQIFDLSAG